ncbi:MAG: hypothetical protein PHS14_14115 [Elusimicrobia bacterium]|nr:hypothetical protein [Elusimicrobiota bacterium]
MAKKIVAEKKIVAKKAVLKAPARKNGLQVVIDYPRVHEIVLPGHYSIRLTALGAGQAQVRFDGGEWVDCRESLGHFWHDWTAQAGQARIESRARIGKGRWSPTEEREVVVKPNEASFVG